MTALFSARRPPILRLAGSLLLGAMLLAPGLRASDKPALRLEAVGTTLRVVTPSGQVVEGAQLTGAVLTTSVGGDVLRLRIASVRPDPAYPAGVLLYDLQVVEAGGAERPLCGPDPQGQRLGFPLAGRTDETGALRPAEASVFEIGCTSGAQGKCLRFGYTPWSTGEDGRSRLDRFNACVRAMRADYCGDGRSRTRDGTLVVLREAGPDEGGSEGSDRPADFRFEAAWGPDGALCVAHTRIPDLHSLEDLANTCPRLRADLGPERCAPNRAGALLVNESR